MAKMKAVQPEMMRLKELHKDDKVKLQQEMMALYRKEKINPASGCLPVLIQIPFFFAIYKMLFISLEMRHQPFFGWIKDLSAADPTTIFNLFGLIPWDPPSFMIIGIWPILMGASMWVQQKLNPAPADPVQAKKDFIARQPMGRLGTAEEIAAVAVYLASDDATFTTGTTISVDGGISI